MFGPQACYIAKLPRFAEVEGRGTLSWLFLANGRKKEPGERGRNRYWNGLKIYERTLQKIFTRKRKA